MPISQHAYAFDSSSTYTACAYEIAIGNADMCWAPLWTTAERRRLVQFSGIIFSDMFYVVTHKEDSNVTDGQLFNQNWFDDASTIFTPFTPSLWIAVLFSFMYTGVVLIFMAEPATSLSAFCSKLPSDMLRGANSIASGDVPDTEKHTFGAWFLSLLLGFIALVLQTNYTSVVTTSLVANQQTGQITSLAQGVRGSYRFCIPAAAHQSVLVAHPELNGLLVDVPAGYPHAFEGMDSGDCALAIITDQDWGQAITESHWCNTKFKLPEVVVTLPNAVPIAQDLVGSCSYAIEASLEGDGFDQLTLQGWRYVRLGGYSQRSRLAAAHRPRTPRVLSQQLYEPAPLLGRTVCVVSKLDDWYPVHPQPDDRPPPHPRHWRDRLVHRDSSRHEAARGDGAYGRRDGHRRRRQGLGARGQGVPQARAPRRLSLPQPWRRTHSGPRRRQTKGQCTVGRDDSYTTDLGGGRGGA